MPSGCSTPGRSIAGWNVRHGDSTEYLLEVLADSDCLLVVDNCEHLIGPVAPLVDQVLSELPGCPHSDDQPRAAGHRRRIALPAAAARPAADRGLGGCRPSQHPAVRLLIERAQAVSAGFRVDDTTVAHVTEIVRRLDGLPLAIELAAARLRVMPIGEIAVRLSDRFRLLTGGSRTAMPRHRTLRAVVEWSWDLLAPDERLLAERLAVFPAGATVGSAIAICGDNLLPATDIGDLLLSLVDKSLLTMIEGPELRYRMLETIREYGTEQLADRGEARAARTAHAYYYARITAELDPVLRTAGQLLAIETLGLERDNILAGLRFLAESDEPADRATSLDLALSLSWYWTMIGANSEAAIWLGLALQATEGIDHPERLWAEAAHSLSTLFLGTSDSRVDMGDLQAEMCSLARRLSDAPAPRIVGLGDPAADAGVFRWRCCLRGVGDGVDPAVPGRLVSRGRQGQSSAVRRERGRSGPDADRRRCRLPGFRTDRRPLGARVGVVVARNPAGPGR